MFNWILENSFLIIFFDLAIEASEDQMETDDIDGSSNNATEKDDAEDAAPASEEIDETTEKDDVSFFLIIYFT